MYGSCGADGGLAHDHSIRGRTAEGEDTDGVADEAKRPKNDARSQQGNRRVFQAVNPHDIEGSAPVLSFSILCLCVMRLSASS